ncbi:unnamed protein product [Cyprideis torosa]|uniref:Uncharacterized protein n=1 Tax=Cyprideis torosa TaxID=163714 RepID=A0A7R8ZKD5_9CRUS|nr:unnamed protein product [Cyprideis torosa]CAG0890668.1 unnamed protein product [Cyprideis torosa]
MHTSQVSRPVLLPWLVLLCLSASSSVSEEAAENIASDEKDLPQRCAADDEACWEVNTTQEDIQASETEQRPLARTPPFNQEEDYLPYDPSQTDRGTGQTDPRHGQGGHNNRHRIRKLREFASGANEVSDMLIEIARGSHRGGGGGGADYMDYLNLRQRLQALEDYVYRRQYDQPQFDLRQSGRRFYGTAALHSFPMKLGQRQGAAGRLPCSSPQRSLIPLGQGLGGSARMANASPNMPLIPSLRGAQTHRPPPFRLRARGRKTTRAITRVSLDRRRACFVRGADWKSPSGLEPSFTPSRPPQPPPPVPPGPRATVAGHILPLISIVPLQQKDHTTPYSIDGFP